MRDLIDVSVSYRAFSDTITILCDEDRIDHYFSDGPTALLDGQILNYQPDFDTFFEVRKLQDSKIPNTCLHVIVGIQIIGADVRRTSGYAERHIPKALVRMMLQTIDHFKNKGGDSLAHSAGHSENFQVAIGDLSISEKIEIRSEVELHEVKALSAAIDGFGAAQHNLMLRNNGGSAKFSLSFNELEMRTAWSTLAHDIDAAQGLRPVSSIARAIGAEIASQALPSSIGIATNRSLVDLWDDRRWAVVAQTMREAMAAVGELAAGTDESAMGSTVPD